MSWMINDTATIIGIITAAVFTTITAATKLDIIDNKERKETSSTNNLSSII